MIDPTTDASDLIRFDVEKLKNDKTQPKFPPNTRWAASIGELLDNEFERLTEQYKMSIDDAIIEVTKLGDYNKYWNSVTKKPFVLSEKTVYSAYERHFAKLKIKAFNYIKNKIKYNGISTPEQAIEWIKNLIEPVLLNKKQGHIVATGIVHWGWQVKRRLHGLKPKNHITIGFINEGLGDNGQGSGKTTFALNLCGPFMDSPKVKGHEQFLFSDTDLSDLTDKKVWSDILGKIIVFLDDVSPETKADAAIFKTLASCNGSKSARPVYGRKQKMTLVLFSALFTANTDNFGDIIKDNTGNRRFLPIMVGDFKEKIPEEIDFTSFWQMIDENWNCFVDQKMFRDIQKEHVTKSSLELLLDQYGIEPGKNYKESRAISAIDLKIILNKHFPKEKSFSTTQSVTKRMEYLGYTPTDKAGDRGKHIGYLMKFTGNGYDRWRENLREYPVGEVDLRLPS